MEATIQHGFNIFSMMAHSSTYNKVVKEKYCGHVFI